jgi:hypothetical protein
MWSCAIEEITLLKKRNYRQDSAPLHLPPEKRFERHSPAEDTRPLEVVILLYSYNPVQSCGALETSTSLPEKIQKEYKKYPFSIKAETLYGDA